MVSVGPEAPDVGGPRLLEEPIHLTVGPELQRHLGVTLARGSSAQLRYESATAAWAAIPTAMASSSSRIRLEWQEWALRG